MCDLMAARLAAGSVSSEGGLALEEHEAMLAVAEEDVMVGAAAD